MNLCDIREVKALLGRHGFRFSKSMGQNFLVADWVPREIAAAGGGDGGCGVLEIGPGIGCLTQELCRCAGKVVSVELDHALLPVLEETMDGAENFTLISGDILKLDIPALADQHFQGLTPMVCANLPYNITTPVLRALVEAKRFASITVMVQREVALRLAARPGTGDYGALSVYMQYHTQPEVLFDVPPSCFLPAPKVTSAVVRCQVRTVPAVHTACGEDFFFQVVRAAFAQRRKTLLNSLSSVFGSQPGKDRLAAVIANCGLHPAVRGETLGLEEFAALADGIHSFS
ncbi:MAG: 16S rRNA (adenine(1518)-N(6)/adenine(1519)-N(6))-dimethyltransferase RsmA [Oscillospiraceae bacterium]|nr:16S rRNA (adenine(1518)-N(6)/adenine(1519)-N(6))-dimethyltransferase RsmA [Oscillospiraceae bacterium]MCI9317290.1 16S rRNA (adenine(1518)-N(6)/adenine(1519)-N(6))-dimethyltransferase RsmA [Oscillospiraceae bacterium]